MIDDRNDMLELVDRLTRPHMVANWVHDDLTGERKIVRVQNDGLLQQLRDAIVGGIGSHQGAAAAGERLPIDASALEYYQLIETQIGEWFVDITREPVYLELERTLRRWYIAMESKQDHPGYGKHLLTLSQWVAGIEAKFDPPRTLEMTVNEYFGQVGPDKQPIVDGDGVAVPEVKRDSRGNPILDRDGKEIKLVKARRLAHCPNPECGADIAFDPKTGDQQPALILEYREMSNETVEGSKVICRACGTEWAGGVGVRLVSWHMGIEEASVNTPKNESSKTLAL